MNCLQLVEMNKRYHGFVHAKALQGVRLAYQLQFYTQPNNHVVRGFIERSGPGLDDGSGCNLKVGWSLDPEFETLTDWVVAVFRQAALNSIS